MNGEYHITYEYGLMGISGGNGVSGFPRGQWIHVGITISSSQTQFWANGNLMGTVAIGNTCSGNYLFGAFTDGYEFPARMNDIHVWNKICVQSEIQNCMNGNYL